ncbi:response regulator [Amphibacillus sp. Q70]|uniref:response regulator n=1 Tax=Amphibacillus sp. Q70 TaxID=3453416 RepID=UPI003F855F9F
MLNICIIDDEHLALEYLDLLLNKIAGVKVVGKYSDPQDLTDHVRNQKVDAIFLDIHMPGIKGIDLAEQLLNIQPALHIVFVTGFNEYAVKAFELNALDYILKPVQKDRLQLSIDRIKQKHDIKSNVETPQSTYMIQNLGALSINQDGQPVEVKWRTAKTKELFAYLVQNHRNTIRKSELTSLMWDNLPWEKAHSQLYSTIYQIRKVIQHIGIPIKIVSQDEFYRIKIEGVQIQSSEWKHSALQLLEERTVSVTQYFALLEDYQGDYLEEMQHTWILKERSTIKALWLQLIGHLIEHINQHENTSSYVISKLYALVSFDDEATRLVQSKITR